MAAANRQRRNHIHKKVNLEAPNVLPHNDAREHPNIAPLCRFIEGNPQAAFIIEFFGDTPEEAKQKADKLADKGVTVLCVHASEIDKEALNEWMKEYNVPFAAKTINHDAEKICFAWGVKSLPWLILADERHVVRAEGFGLDTFDDQIEALQKQ